MPEAARYLAVPATTLPRQAARLPVIPFIGLAEGAVLTAIRRSGVSMQRIRPALEHLDSQFAVAHALVSRRLYSDGAERLFGYPESADDACLRGLEFDEQGYARLIRLPAYEIAEVVVPGSTMLSTCSARANRWTLSRKSSVFRASTSKRRSGRRLHRAPGRLAHACLDRAVPRRTGPTSRVDGTVAGWWV